MIQSLNSNFDPTSASSVCFISNYKYPAINLVCPITSTVLNTPDASYSVTSPIGINCSTVNYTIIERVNRRRVIKCPFSILNENYPPIDPLAA